MNIIEKNYFRLLRSGAYGNEERMEPMSKFKWNKLFQMINSQDVVQIFFQGANAHRYDTNFNLPKDLTEEIKKANIQITDFRTVMKTQYNLSNKWLNDRLHKIRDHERHSIDTSLETLYLLNIIIYNINNILNRGMSLRGIIELGIYLRTKGDKVDYVKLENWIKKLHIQRIVNLQCSVLITIFDFDINEIPFVNDVVESSYKMTLRGINYTTKNTKEEWHFRQSSNGFVENNSAILRRNLRRSLRFFNYAPIEASSNFLNSFRRSLSEIEE